MQVRINAPDGGDMFFGYCHWDGKELVSGDGDDYSLTELISQYEFNEDKTELTYWIIGEWQ